MKLQALLLGENLLFFGVITMVVAGRISLFEIDLKKIVALSTLSQLGFLAVAVGAGAFALSLFHIMSHAFTKSALFIVVGVILHKNFGVQDKRGMRWAGKQGWVSFAL